MITLAETKIYAHVIDASGIVEILSSKAGRSTRGRKPAFPNATRTMLVGLMLSMSKDGKATLSATHELLTTRLTGEAQEFLEVRRPNGEVISEKILYRTWERAVDNITWTHEAKPDLSARDRVRRRRAARTVVNQLMDVFDIGHLSKSFALDGTGIRSWSTGRHDTKMTTNGQVHRGLSDPDAHWGHKTAGVGETSEIFGYENHVLMQVPDYGQDVSDIPLLIRRLALIPSAKSNANQMLKLIDQLPKHQPVGDLLVDRWYSNLRTENWADGLTRRGINQVLDLRKDDHGFSLRDRMLWTAGVPHCPGTPQQLGTIRRPGPANRTPNAVEQFETAIGQRQAYAMHIHQRKLDQQRLVVTCPAVYGTVGCPLKEGSVAVAHASGLPVVTPPKHPLPGCCSAASGTVTVSISSPDRKHHQRHYWGSAKWAKSIARRSYVEGVFGQQRNKSLEALDRGQHRFMGLAANLLCNALVAASYNLRTIRAWNDNRPAPDTTNPLFADIPTPAVWFESAVDAA